ncbi:MAG: aminotransferase class V-fold PLP-dependent enzyme [Spirochaetales bacterium]|nr:aminotransferase class V-fold PLP-dependent enzyme [Spirochaetales bacterium]
MRVYMDNNATTPLHPEVAKTMADSLQLFGNPSSMHSYGRETSAWVEGAREKVATFLDADTSSIIFTGGGSESNNTALKLVTCTDATCVHCPANRKQIITTVIEHPSVLNTVQKLESRGVPAKYVGVDPQGKIDLNELEEAVSDKSALVSVMMANNEIGTVQNIRKISEIAHRHGALVHTDAVQAVGKLPVSVRDLDVDFLSFSAHKLYGPKGIGVLYARRGAPFCTFIHGGHQEAGRRAGTLNTLGIIGLGKAVEIASREMNEREERVRNLKNKLREGIVDSIPDIHVNGHPTDSLAGTLNVSFRGAEGESILLYLDLEGIAVSTGSACASGSLDPSHVLLATGIGAELAHGSIRFSLGGFNTEAEVDYVLDKLPGIISKIRSMSSIYERTGERI